MWRGGRGARDGTNFMDFEAPPENERERESWIPPVKVYLSTQKASEGTRSQRGRENTRLYRGI